MSYTLNLNAITFEAFVALDHMAKDLDELKNDDKIKADDKRVKNCTALIKGFHLLMSSVTHRPSI